MAFGKVGNAITGSADLGGGGALPAWDIITDDDLCIVGANACYTQVGSGGLQWIQIDLGQKLWVDTVVVWHWYIDSRTYKDTKTAVSPTGKFAGEELVLFDSTKNDKIYPENPEGHLMEFKPTQIRYIRDWANGSDKNADSHWIEIAAFSAQGPGAVSPQGKLATLWAKVKFMY